MQQFTVPRGHTLLQVLVRLGHRPKPNHQPSATVLCQNPLGVSTPCRMSGRLTHLYLLGTPQAPHSMLVGSSACQPPLAGSTSVISTITALTSLRLAT